MKMVWAISSMFKKGTHIIQNKDHKVILMISFLADEKNVGSSPLICVISCHAQNNYSNYSSSQLKKTIKISCINSFKVVITMAICAKEILGQFQNCKEILGLLHLRFIGHNGKLSKLPNLLMHVIVFLR